MSMKAMRPAETLAGIFRAEVSANHPSRHEGMLIAFVKRVQKETLEGAAVRLKDKAEEARELAKANPGGKYPEIVAGAYEAAMDLVLNLIPQ